jgi:hypothetical protein
MSLMFPALCVDNFYKNPDEIKKFALEQTFQKSNGNYPGERTETIDSLSPEIFDGFCQKLFSAYYNFQYNPISWEVETYFQRIPAFTEDPNDIINKGWIHADTEASIMAGVIYLNQNEDTNSGTSLFKPYDFHYESSDTFEEEHALKKCFFRGEDVDLDAYRKLLQKNHDAYRETARFNNVYNRLVCYDSLVHHRANQFGSPNEDRLTQVFFVRKIMTDYSPIDRMEAHSNL